VPEADRPRVVELALRITNVSGEPLRFNRFDTVGMAMQDEAGQEVALRFVRGKTKFLEPLILAPGESGVIPRRLTLRRGKDGETLSLEGRDGTGSQVSAEGLGPGLYTVAFAIRNDERASKDIEDHMTRLNRRAEAATPYWLGNVATEGLEVQIVVP
jgi:hypothetical protein